MGAGSGADFHRGEAPSIEALIKLLRRRLTVVEAMDYLCAVRKIMTCICPSLALRFISRIPATERRTICGVQSHADSAGRRDIRV